jgi:hypothetical protein
MLQHGYDLATITSRLSTIKVYAELAIKAGTVDADNYSRIKTVKGYQDKELRRVDDHRTVMRIGKKKTVCRRRYGRYTSAISKARSASGRSKSRLRSTMIARRWRGKRA